ncbi:MAG: LPS export ABC transporter ATP-binding protein [Candidatus Tectomicrobia bacterium]|uniref:LPS export ABC transporter ATP-binding protein n=1 Tax=Tectimicrobiota bacterium TaxID=2528274 RepID=A0A932MRI2_UNCTE|nr:LPS export ABC transporter ATP-binding protein [Candidatus Tectomicrobia bacterium]
MLRRRNNAAPLSAPDANGYGGRILAARGLAKSFSGRRVVDGVDLDVRPGEIVGLLGPNGAGKTTIFYMIVGLIVPEGGEVILDQEPITGVPMYKRARMGVSYLPQEASVFRRLSVEENILAVLELMPGTSAGRRERAEELLADLNIAQIRKTKGYALSGGERRRVEIARALATSPTYILLDEPFAGIDPIVVNDIQTIVRGLRERGIGILLTDHNVREALQIADRAYIISEGKILEAGDPLKIASSERARHIYLGESFRL